MNKSFDLAELFKLVVLGAAGIIFVGLILFFTIGSNTYDVYADGNLNLTFYLKALIAGLLVCGLETLYFGIRFRKKGGFRAGLLASLSSVVSAVTSFFICVIFRAPLCGYVFSVMLLAVCVSLICAAVHFDFLSTGSKKGKKGAKESAPPAAKALRRLALFLLLTLVILLVAFVCALILDANMLIFYAFPAIVTVIFSTVFTLSTCGRLFDK